MNLAKLFLAVLLIIVGVGFITPLPLLGSVWTGLFIIFTGALWLVEAFSPNATVIGRVNFRRRD